MSATEYGWLLEVSANGGAPVYVKAEAGYLSSTQDNDRALRFAREADALAFSEVAEKQLKLKLTAVEHAWG